MNAMFNKILTATIAALMLATFAVPALACPADNSLTSQFNALNKEIKTVRHNLEKERALDQALYGKIKNIRNMIQVDPDKLAAYRLEMKPLTDQLSSLKKDLATAIKNNDTAAADALMLKFKDTLAQISAVKAKYPDIVTALQHKHHVFSDIKVLKNDLEPKYAELKVLVTKAKTINADIETLAKAFRAAVKANDTAKATDLLSQLTAKKVELKENLMVRVDLRKQITALMTKCLIKIN
jgi:chromosome segregation ATPase